MTAAATAAVRLLVAAGALQQARTRRRPSSPAELARRLDPKFVVAPVTALLSDLAVRVVTQPHRREIATAPPRTGKSQLLSIWTVVWALMRDPETEIVLVSYNDDLAQSQARKARQIIIDHGDYLGLKLRRDQQSVTAWGIEGHKGGLRAVGVGSSITGHGGSIIIIDDLVKNMEEADSATHRAKNIDAWQSTVSTRIEPGGSVILVMTRWHVGDLAGHLLATEPDVWRLTNVPAVAEEGIPDSLGREPGTTMTSARGYTTEDFASHRRTSGERAWYALFQGVPSTPAGGLVQREWLDQHRIAAAPPYPLRSVVAVDPADSGERDAAGIVAASLGPDGIVSLIADATGKMTAEEWSTAAIKLAVDVGASEIWVEAFASGETYQRVVKDALARQGISRAITVKRWPPKGSPRKGDAVARAARLLQALEVGTCRIAGTFPVFEQSAIQWQAGQHQPDSLAALVIAHDVLAPTAGAQYTFVVPDLTAKVTDRAGIGSRSLAPVTPIRRELSRRVSGGSHYDPTAYPTRVIH